MPNAAIATINTNINKMRMRPTLESTRCPNLRPQHFSAVDRFLICDAIIKVLPRCIYAESLWLPEEPYALSAKEKDTFSTNEC